MLDLINSNFLGDYNERNTYIEKFNEYSVKIKFLNIIFLEEDIDIDEGIIEGSFIYFFSYIYPKIEFILSFEISNNNNVGNAPDNTTSILFDKNKDLPNLRFEIKNIFATIQTNYIEFRRNSDNSYKYCYPPIGASSDYIDINILIDNFKKYPKFHKIFKDQRKKLEQFLFNSFNYYLDDIISQYPEPDGVFLYKLAVKKLLNIKTFSLESETLEKISINSFEEKSIDLPNRFCNITTEFEITFKNSTTQKFTELIPEIYYYINDFWTITNTKIGNESLNQIFDGLFMKMVFDYIN